MPSDCSSIKDDEIWGDDEGISEQEWSKMNDQYTNTGYREGITAGKEEALQEGFDDGFAFGGVPLGRRIGILRGIANGLKSVLSTCDLDVDKGQQYDLEMKRIIQELGGISLADLAPPDLEAKAHEKEHLEEAPGDLAKDFSILGILNQTDRRPAMEKIKAIQVQLLAILEEVGINPPETLLS